MLPQSFRILKILQETEFLKKNSKKGLEIHEDYPKMKSKFSNLYPDLF